MKKKLRITGITLAILFVVIFLLYFIFRSSLLNYVINRAKNSFKTKYNATLTIGKATMGGICSVAIDEINIIPENNDSILYIHKVAASFNIFKIIFGDVSPSKLTIEGGYARLIKYDSLTSNYSAFAKRKAKKENEVEDENNKINFAESAYHLLDKILDGIPKDFDIKKFNVSFSNLGKKFYAARIKNLSLRNDFINSITEIETPDKMQNIELAGSFNASEMTGDLLLHTFDHSMLTMPLVDEKYGLKLGCNELQLKLESVDYDDDILHVLCSASGKNVLINHERLADHDIRIDNGSGRLKIEFGENYIALDSSSTFVINHIKAHPFFYYRKFPDKQFHLKLNIENMPSQDFFNSLPTGMFDGLNGIQSVGYIAYKMECLLNDSSPRDVIFESEFIPSDFKIKTWGTAYLPQLNGPFTYIPYEYGVAQRPIRVDYGNQNFIPIENISNYLKNAILTSEDPSFYSHKGFVMEAIRQSIAQNYIAKKFARGGSTISMQLVKNIFLSRKKTLARKLEEMLLVWLLENMNVSSKSRMYEVYLNIIEWGPGIYGAGEASNFYFNKSPANLNLSEALYLASIIPRPKGFAWNFNDSTGELRKFMVDYMKNLTRLMAARKLIEEIDTTGFEPHVKLRGASLQMMKKYRHIPSDSLQEDEMKLEEILVPESE